MWKYAIVASEGQTRQCIRKAFQTEETEGEKRSHSAHSFCGADTSSSLVKEPRKQKVSVYLPILIKRKQKFNTEGVSRKTLLLKGIYSKIK